MSPHAPVHRFACSGGDVVLKRTGHPRSQGATIAAWLRALSARGIAVVAPDARFAPNPKPVPGSGWPGEWVIYPFVDGEPYTAAPRQVEAAGRLLGVIHAASGSLGDGMATEPRLPLRGCDWVAEHAKRASGTIDAKAPALAQAWAVRLSQRLAAHEETRAKLGRRSLPLAACAWDYKASNLVYVLPDRPVLIDPDHAGRIPRVYDLACAVLLFHCDYSHAPPRLFDRGELSAFFAAYMGEVELTDTERSAWPDVLLAAWIDQALWMLANWAEGFDDSRERRYLTELASMDLAEFVLDPHLKAPRA